MVGSFSREASIVNVIGAGLAGSEAAFRIARRGVGVRLFEMRPDAAEACSYPRDPERHLIQ